MGSYFIVISNILKIMFWYTFFLKNENSECIWIGFSKNISTLNVWKKIIFTHETKKIDRKTNTNILK